jgi:hypothetical protein
MSVFKKIIKWILFLIFVFILSGITYIIYLWSHCNCTGNDILRTLPNDKDSKIAVFKPDREGMRKIRLGRFLFKQPYKYPFYSPQYYSDYFLIDFQSNDSLVFVVDNKDTVRWNGLYKVDTVPSILKGYNFSGDLLVTYYQDTLFQSNIEHKPAVFILKQISLGPTEFNCLGKCN